MVKEDFDDEEEHDYSNQQQNNSENSIEGDRSKFGHFVGNLGDTFWLNIISLEIKFIL